ncbi:hypothetical protein [Aestuariicoccus sp. MJ-SS9]|uniref:hypothetical protein n=1 Tax=Aestuariicoccus sp. MJ-SS9 TaxID=3079855 RepID=UPI002915A565|nr:hypothetical protein [Aestuariicoccus sp. MJ-SS9]MDU8912408.1 hypothetical protein [Aestuariicoccus sp. MJ-SS9]
MTRILMLMLALGLVAACEDTNPLMAEEEAPDGEDGGGEGDEGGGDEGGPIVSDGDLPPGTASPTPNTGIFRYEAMDDDTGSGFLAQPSYNASADTFTVDQLAFDGDDTYSRDNVVGSLGPFAVYENDSIAVDPITGVPIEQFEHKAIYAVSQSGETELAIVRTGAYQDYGFGGFVYQRNGGVTLPTGGQASFTGDYAALRDFDGQGGIEYVQGDASITVDFDAFETGAVAGQITNRVIFNEAGEDITQDFLTAMGETYESNFVTMPTLVFDVVANGLDANGEATGPVDSTIVTTDGTEVFESGTFYAILSGDGATEVAGILVVTSEDPRIDGVTIRETGGFIATR